MNIFLSLLNTCLAISSYSTGNSFLWSYGHVVYMFVRPIAFLIFNFLIFFDMFSQERDDRFELVTFAS
jgi:hypothetical protein